MPLDGGELACWGVGRWWVCALPLCSVSRGVERKERLVKQLFVGPGMILLGDLFVSGSIQ